MYHIPKLINIIDTENRKNLGMHSKVQENHYLFTILFHSVCQGCICCFMLSFQKTDEMLRDSVMSMCQVSEASEQYGNHMGPHLRRNPAPLHPDSTPNPSICTSSQLAEQMDIYIYVLILYNVKNILKDSTLTTLHG